MVMRFALVVASSLLGACNQYVEASPTDGGGASGGGGPDAAAPDSGPPCVRERIDLTNVVITPENTFTGDGSGTGSLTVTDAGVVAEVDAGAKNLLGLVLTARGFVRRLGFPARTVKIRFETRSESIVKNAIVGCWIIHVDSRLGFDFSQRGFTYGTYLHSFEGNQSLRGRAPANFVEQDNAFAAVRAVGGPAQVIQLQSTRNGDGVTYTGAIEVADGGVQAPLDGGISFQSVGLTELPTEIVCGASVNKEEASARASARWVEIDACP